MLWIRLTHPSSGMWSASAPSYGAETMERAVLVPPVTRAPPPTTCSADPQATRRRTFPSAASLPGLSFT